MKTKTIVALASVLMCCTAVGLLGGCAGTAQETVHWGYSGEHGPKHWGEMNPEWAACSEGKEQSPVDIPTGPGGAPVNAADIAFSYQPSALSIVNNGHTVKINYDEGSFIEVEGTKYTLLQFHFHALSEHTVAGEHSDMEAHFVHQSADGGYAVVGVFLQRGAANAAYEPVWMHAPAEEGVAETIEGVTVSAIDLLPQDKSYYRYDGSFTTPPGTEGVRWFVMATPVELSDSQISTFEAMYDHNYRPVQPLNSRTFH